MATTRKISALSPILAAAALWLCAASSPAEPNPRIPPQQENRFLFIIDSAYAMRGYSNAIARDVVALLESDMRGEFRSNDTLGLWVYNDSLHPEYPMQVWTKEDKEEIIAGMANFLKEMEYHKRAHLDRVMPALNYVVKSSARLTVILIFDGVEMVHGTPFDAEINDLQKAYARELKAAHEPFVIVMAARNGAIYDYTINYPGAISIPHTAFPEKVETNAPVAAVTNAPEPLKIGPSIIMSGKKVLQPPSSAEPVASSAPAPAPVTNTAAPVATPPPREAAPIIAQTAPPNSPPPQITPTVLQSPPPVAPPPVPRTTQPPIAAKQEPAPAKIVPAPAAQPATAKVEKPEPKPAPPLPKPAPVVATPATPSSSPVVLIVVAVSLLVVAIGLAAFLLRRPKQAQQPSIISQSLDRPR